jgi:hypothetical protein
MRRASGPDLRGLALPAPAGVVLPALGLAVLAVVAALVAGLAAGRGGSPSPTGFPRAVAELVTPTPGVQQGRLIGVPAPTAGPAATARGPAPAPR